MIDSIAVVPTADEYNQPMLVNRFIQIVIPVVAMALVTCTAAQDAPASASAPDSRGSATSADTVAAGLACEHLYNGIGRSIMMRATADSASSVIDLVLMDGDGLILISPRSIRPSRFDLNETMPALEQAVIDHGRACFLQMLIDEEPVGSAVIVEPMLDRLIPITEVVSHPTRDQKHTKITGWRTPPEGPGEQTLAADGEPAPLIKPRVCSGFRIYVERDVLMETSHGTIRLALRPDAAPNTAWNFLQLCEGGFYRDVPFHRIVPATSAGDPFVIQGGDPSGTGEGGPGYWLPMEDSDLPHDFGVISMARSDQPDSAGSQFFLCLSRSGTARLDGQYCGFGYAVAGADTILAIADVELADISRGRPVDPPVMLETRLVSAPPRTPGQGRPDERVSPEQPQIIQPDEPTRLPR